MVLLSNEFRHWFATGTALWIVLSTVSMRTRFRPDPTAQHSLFTGQEPCISYIIHITLRSLSKVHILPYGNKKDDIYLGQQDNSKI